MTQLAKLRAFSSCILIIGFVVVGRTGALLALFRSRHALAQEYLWQVAETRPPAKQRASSQSISLECSAGERLVKSIAPLRRLAHHQRINIDLTHRQTNILLATPPSATLAAHDRILRRLED